MRPGRRTDALFALAVLAFAAAPASLARGAGAVPAPAIQTSVTGEIGKLGPGRIAIGRTACSIPASLATKAGRFVVTDPVEITCRNGRLESIEYAPEVGLTTHRASDLGRRLEADDRALESGQTH